jgi:hypothetical protein
MVVRWIEVVAGDASELCLVDSGLLSCFKLRLVIYEENGAAASAAALASAFNCSALGFILPLQLSAGKERKRETKERNA